MSCWCGSTSSSSLPSGSLAGNGHWASGISLRAVSRNAIARSERYYPSRQNAPMCWLLLGRDIYYRHRSVINIGDIESFSVRRGLGPGRIVTHGDRFPEDFSGADGNHAHLVIGFRRTVVVRIWDA